MTDWDDDLRHALRRKDPPADFAERVLARTPQRRRASWAWAAIAACLFASIGGAGWREYQGRRAKQSLLMALEIAGSKLDHARKKVQDLNERTKHD